MSASGEVQERLWFWIFFHKSHFYNQRKHQCVEGFWKLQIYMCGGVKCTEMFQQNNEKLRQIWLSPKNLVDIFKIK